MDTGKLDFPLHISAAGSGSFSGWVHQACLSRWHCVEPQLAVPHQLFVCIQPFQRVTSQVSELRVWRQKVCPTIQFIAALPWHLALHGPPADVPKKCWGSDHRYLLCHNCNSQGLLDQHRVKANEDTVMFERNGN